MTVRYAERPYPVGIPFADDRKLSAVRAQAFASGARRDHFDMHVGIPPNSAVESSIMLPHCRFAQRPTGLATDIVLGWPFTATVPTS
jgi:hypothetical protein